MDVAISVVIPSFNRAHTLPESLDSVLMQEGPSFEVIVVDDGSTDDTASVLAAYGDPVRVVRQENAGIAAARNAGVAAARGRYIAFHDSDDLALPGRLAIPYEHMVGHDGVRVVLGNGVFLPPEGSDGPTRPWLRPKVAAALDGRDISEREVFRWNLGQLQGTLISRRSLLEVGPLDSEFLILDDLDIMLRLSVRYRTVFLNQPLFAYRQLGGVTQNRMMLREESIRLAEKFLKANPEALERVGKAEYARRQGRRYARLATERSEAGDLRGAREAIAEACRLVPHNVSYRLRALALTIKAR